MLELSSNTIQLIGIFGRLSPEQEAYFDGLEQQYGYQPTQNPEWYDVFRHLTLTFAPNATVTDLSTQLELLRDLKPFLPLKIKVNKPFVKDEESYPGAEHIALEFDLTQTKEIVDLVRQRVGDVAVATWYTKVVWFVLKDRQQAVIDELSDLKEMVFTDFYLVSNKQDEENTIYQSSKF
jgi:hypothetical protein